MNAELSVLLIASSVDVGGLEQLLQDVVATPPAGTRAQLMLLRPDGDYERQLEARRVARQTFSLEAPSAFALARLQRRVRQLRPDIIQTFGLRADLAGRLLSAPGATRIGTVAAPFLANRTLRRLAARLPLRPPVAYWADCEARARDGVREHGLPGERIQVVYPGIAAPSRPLPAQVAEIRQQLGLAPRDPLLVAVGNLRAVKGHDLALAAMPAIRRLHPGARLAVVGKDLENGALQQKAREAGLGNVLYLAGSSDNTPLWLAAADLVVQPSRSEGLPRVPLEAMALERPVLATRVGGLPELLDERSGWLVPPEDPDALAAAALEVLADEHQRRNRAAGGAARVRECFSRERMVADFAGFWRAYAPAARRIDLTLPGRPEWIPIPQD